eukprot:ANDGO_04546.mRNA.1 Protein unc-50 homolog
MLPTPRSVSSRYTRASNANANASGSSSNHGHSQHHLSHSNQGSFPTFAALSAYVRRAMMVNHMDIEYALEQMWELLVHPKLVYSLYFRSRKTSKRQYARDDPAFFVILSVFFLVSSIAYLVTMQVSSVGKWFYLMFGGLAFHFLLVGLVISTTTWLFANSFLKDPRRISMAHSANPQADDNASEDGRSVGSYSFSPDQDAVEWFYAFDIHCNAYWAFFVLSSVLQLFLLPFLLHEGFLARVLSNTIYLAAYAYYFYITWAGFVELPFLQSQEVFLYPLIVVFVMYLLWLLLGFNCTIFIINMYYS